MKVCVIQPRYSFNEIELDSCFEELLSKLDLCDGSEDIIVLPEYGPDEAARYFDMGIDTVLTNDYLNIYNAVTSHGVKLALSERRKKNHKE